MIDKYTDDVVYEEVDGVTYCSTKFPAIKGLELLGRVVRAIGAQGLQAIVFKHRAEVSQVFPFVTAFLGNSPHTFEAVEQLAVAILGDINLPRQLCAQLKVASTKAGCSPGPVQPIFDQHFSGELPHLYRVLSFVLAHNFLGFSDGSRLTNGSRTSDGTNAETSSD
jgi:hypothetical protein